MSYKDAPQAGDHKLDGTALVWIGLFIVFLGMTGTFWPFAALFGFLAAIWLIYKGVTGNFGWMMVECPEHSGTRVVNKHTGEVRDECAGCKLEGNDGEPVSQGQR